MRPQIDCAHSGVTQREARRRHAMTSNFNLNRRHILKGGLGASAAAIGLRGGISGGRSASAQTVKLVNVEHDSRPLDNAAYEAVYNAFKTQHPDIEIEFQIIPWEQARSKMLTLAQGDSLPNMGR